MIADEIVYFKDGEKEPLLVTHPEKSGNMIEKALAEPSGKLLGLIADLAQGQNAGSVFVLLFYTYIRIAQGRTVKFSGDAGCAF